MKFVIFIISIILGIKTVSYGLFEINENKNTFGGIFVTIFAIVSTILPNVIVYLKGI